LLLHTKVDCHHYIRHITAVLNDQIIRGQVVRLYPTAEQVTRQVQWTGALRWIWNHFVEAEEAKFAATGKFLWRAELYELAKVWRTEKDWIRDIPANAFIQIAADFDTALRKYLRDRKAGRVKGFKRSARYKTDRTLRDLAGFPAMRRKGVDDPSIYVPNRFRFIDAHTVVLPKLGKMKFRGSEAPEGGRPYAARIWCDAGDRWMLSIQWLCPKPVPLPPSDIVIAVDLGVSRLATVYDGANFLHIQAPRPLRKALRNLRRQQRTLARRQKKSRRRAVQRQRVACIHRRIRNVRKEVNHQLSHQLIAKAGVIITEDLNIKAMARSRLALSVADAGLGQLLTMTAYKAEWGGREQVKVDRFFPSSQQCCGCHVLHREMRNLSRRTLRCNCGNVIDRDDNACVNLYWYREGLGNRAGTRLTRVEIGEQGNVRKHDPVPVVETRIEPEFMGSDLREQKR
jgi:putative transposase